MSRNSDATKILRLAQERGFKVERVKHGGYAIRDAAGQTVTRVPANGHGAPFWIKNALKALGGAAA